MVILVTRPDSGGRYETRVTRDEVSTADWVMWVTTLSYRTMRLASYCTTVVPVGDGVFLETERSCDR
jgi:hypothetical protein